MNAMVSHDELHYVQTVVCNIFRVRLTCCCRLNGKSIKAVAAVMDLPFGRQKYIFNLDPVLGYDIFIVWL